LLAFPNATDMNSLYNKHKELFDAIKSAGGYPYVVGGYVRDTLLGRNPHDIDVVVTGINIPDMDSLSYQMGGAPAYGISFPVYNIKGIEVALARKEKKTGKGHTGFETSVESVTLEQDLRRRDLTINAIAIDPFTDKFIDPYGGINDIKHRVLMPVSDAFGEDPLRVLRAARFAAQLDMYISDSLIVTARQARHEIPSLPGERIFGELQKALRTPKPSVFFDALDQLGALSIAFPEIYALKGRIQPEKYHPEGDTYIHTLETIDRAREMGADDETMFAALVHDLGKAVTPNEDLPRHINHEGLGLPIVEAMSKRLCVSTSYRKVAKLATKEHLNIHRFNDLRPVKKVRLLMRLGVIQDDTLARRVVMVAKADARGRGPLHANNPYPQGDMLLNAAAIVRQVRGHEFAYLKNGEKIAQKIEEARVRALK